jgi:hypothetical protein
LIGGAARFFALWGFFMEPFSLEVDGRSFYLFFLGFNLKTLSLISTVLNLIIFLSAISAIIGVCHGSV